MSKIRIGLLIWTILVSSATAFAADLPKEGSFKATFFGTVVPGETTTLPTVDGKTAFISEQTFTLTNDAGSGFSHRTTGRCLVLNTGKDASGTCASADPDGDLIFNSFRFHGGRTPPPNTLEYIGGTGKYAGLTGHATYTTIGLKTVKGSPHMFEGHIDGTYKLGAKDANAAQ